MYSMFQGLLSKRATDYLISYKNPFIKQLLHSLFDTAQLRADCCQLIPFMNQLRTMALVHHCAMQQFCGKAIASQLLTKTDA